jgi:hypothetical protein
MKLSIDWVSALWRAMVDRAQRSHGALRDGRAADPVAPPRDSVPRAVAHAAQWFSDLSGALS